MKPNNEVVGYLLGCSESSLEQFHLNKLNRAANLEKEMRELLAQSAEQLALAHVAELLRFHRRTLKGVQRRLPGL